MNRTLPVLALALALPLSLSACSDTSGSSSSSSSASQTDGSAAPASTETTSGQTSQATAETPGTTGVTSTERATTPETTPTQGDTAMPTTPASSSDTTGSASPGTATPEAVAGAERLYAFEPSGAMADPWASKGIQSGVITSAADIPAVVAAVPEKGRSAAAAALAKASAQQAPSAQHPWYVFDGTGCSFQLKLEMKGGNPTPVMDPPGPQQEQCLAAEWRMAVYRYDASSQTAAPHTFTAPKA